MSHSTFEPALHFYYSNPFEGAILDFFYNSFNDHALEFQVTNSFTPEK